MSESASRVFTKTVKNDAGDKPCRVNGINRSPNHKSRIQARGGKRTAYPTDWTDGDALPTDKHMPIR